MYNEVVNFVHKPYLGLLVLAVVTTVVYKLRINERNNLKQN